jgi:hypothetical protein
VAPRQYAGTIVVSRACVTCAISCLLGDGSHNSEEKPQCDHRVYEAVEIVHEQVSCAVVGASSGRSRARGTSQRAAARHQSLGETRTREMQSILAQDAYSAPALRKFAVSSHRVRPALGSTFLGGEMLSSGTRNCCAAAGNGKL